MQKTQQDIIYDVIRDYETFQDIYRDQKISVSRIVTSSNLVKLYKESQKKVEDILSVSDKTISEIQDCEKEKIIEIFSYVRNVLSKK